MGRSWSEKLFADLSTGKKLVPTVSITFVKLWVELRRKAFHGTHVIKHRLIKYFCKDARHFCPGRSQVPNAPLDGDNNKKNFLFSLSIISEAVFGVLVYRLSPIFFGIQIEHYLKNHYVK